MRTETAIEAFVSTVENTGGVIIHPFGSAGLVEDPEWVDLAEAYLLACRELGRTPMADECHESCECRNFLEM